VVTNDTGASHVAAAARARSVVVTAALDPWRWAPLDATRHTVVTGARGQDWPDVAAVGAAVERQLACGSMAA
jgi:hypothetical protein